MWQTHKEEQGVRLQLRLLAAVAHCLRVMLALSRGLLHQALEVASSRRGALRSPPKALLGCPVVLLPGNMGCAATSCKAEGLLCPALGPVSSSHDKVRGHNTPEWSRVRSTTVQ